MNTKTNRLVALTLVLTLALALASCGSSGESDLYGTWTAVHVEVGGSKFTIAELEATGDKSLSDFYVILKEGGKAYVHSEGAGALMDWSSTGKSVQLGVQECALKESFICIDKNGIVIFLEKTSDSQIIGEESTTEVSNTTLDSNDLSGILDAIRDDFDSVTVLLMKALDAVYATVGDTYEDYLANKQAITDWYALVQSESVSLFERTRAKSENYYRLVASSIDHKDSDAIDTALEAYSNAVYDGVFDDYCDAIYDGAFDDINEKYYDGIIASARDSANNFSDWLDVSSACFSEWLDANSGFFSLWLDASSDVFSTWLDMNSAFTWGNFDVDAILSERNKADVSVSTTEATTVAEAEDEPGQVLSFCGIDFLIPGYYGELVDNTTARYVGYVYPEQPSTASYMCFFYFDDTTLTQQGWNTTIAQFEKDPNSAFNTFGISLKDESEAAMSEKIAIGGLPAWTLARSVDKGGYSLVSKGSYVYSPVIEKLIYIEIQCLQGYENDTSGYDYLADYTHMLETAVRSASSETSSDWRQFLQDYEAFMDDYIEILKKYHANPADLSILSDYMSMMTKLTEWSDKYDDISGGLDNPDELAEFTQEWMRIYTKQMNALVGF